MIPLKERRRPVSSVQPEGSEVPGIAGALSRFTRRYRWPIVGVWVLLVVAAGMSAGSIASVLSGGGWYAPGMQSTAAADVLGKAALLGRGEQSVTVVITDSQHTVSDPVFADRVREVLDTLAADTKLKVQSRYGWSTVGSEARSRFEGDDHRTVIESVALGIEDGAARRDLPQVQDRLSKQFVPSGVKVSLVSPASFWGEVNKLSQEDLVRAELITFPLIVLVLLVLYRSAVAVGMSLAVGVTAIALTLGVLSPLAHHFELSLFVQNAATMLGLGVGVDYSLFVIARFQEELQRGSSEDRAVANTLRRSGHTIVFSGLTVIATMATLFVIDLNVIMSLAIGAIMVVAFSLLTSILLLPAALHLLGMKINAGRPRFLLPRPVVGADSAGDGRWHKFALVVMRRPVVFGLLAIIVLGLLTLPVTAIRSFSPDAHILPASSPVRYGYDILQREFGVGSTSPVQIVVTSQDGFDSSPQQEALTELANKLAMLPNVAKVQSAVEVQQQVAATHISVFDVNARAGLPDGARQAAERFVSGDGRATLIELQPGTRASDDAARELVKRVRAVTADVHVPGMQIVVGGETADGMDSNAVIENNLGKVVVMMLGVVFALLLVTFRSIAIPVKAVILNAMSIGATYGIMVLIFQKGVLGGFLGLQQTGYLQNFVPILLLALVFSLSTDYEVFLLDRIREIYRKGVDNTLAVARGVESTAPLISGAAILMMVVFGAFGFTGLVPMQQLGLGMAIGIFIDATIVRLILVPVAMRLLGDWNWWFFGTARGTEHRDDHATTRKRGQLRAKASVLRDLTD